GRPWSSGIPLAMLLALLLVFFLLLIRRPPISTLFPYTTLFRSSGNRSSLFSTSQRSRSARVTLNLASSASIVSTASAGSEPSSRSEEHTSELQSRENLVCRLLLEKKKNKQETRVRVDGETYCNY